MPRRRANRPFLGGRSRSSSPPICRGLGPVPGLASFPRPFQNPGRAVVGGVIRAPHGYQHVPQGQRAAETGVHPSGPRPPRSHGCISGSRRRGPSPARCGRPASRWEGKRRTILAGSAASLDVLSSITFRCGSRRRGYTPRSLRSGGCRTVAHAFVSPPVARASRRPTHRRRKPSSVVAGCARVVATIVHRPLRPLPRPPCPSGGNGSSRGHDRGACRASWRQRR